MDPWTKHLQTIPLNIEKTKEESKNIDNLQSSLHDKGGSPLNIYYFQKLLDKQIRSRNKNVGDQA